MLQQIETKGGEYVLLDLSFSCCAADVSSSLRSSRVQFPAYSVLKVSNMATTEATEDAIMVGALGINLPRDTPFSDAALGAGAYTFF